MLKMQLHWAALELISAVRKAAKLSPRFLCLIRWWQIRRKSVTLKNFHLKLTLNFIYVGCTRRLNFLVLAEWAVNDHSLSLGNGVEVSQGEYSISKEETERGLFTVNSNLSIEAVKSSRVDCLASVSALSQPRKSSVTLTVGTKQTHTSFLCKYHTLPACRRILRVMIRYHLSCPPSTVSQ